MINITKKEIIRILSKCIKEYDSNLKNKNGLFVFEDKDKCINKVEVFFGKRNFYHLTGIRLIDKENSECSASQFYNILLKGRISEKNIVIVNSTIDLKLNVLENLMNIDKNAKMIGDFFNHNLYLKTEKIAGHISACMGFIKDEITYISKKYKLDTLLTDENLNIKYHKNLEKI